MKITLSSLKRFIDIDLPVEQVAEHLIQLGIEVDAIHFATPPFSGIVVGEVLSTEKHPEADRLTIAQVSDGKEVLQVVCAAKNCQAKKKYPFASVGATLDLSSKEPLKIKKAKLRGIDSFGMLCAADELGFGGSHEGILELPPSFTTGQDLLELLWDPVLELSLTPNLGHCMSILGIARELSALLNIPLKTPFSSNIHTGKTPSIQSTIADPALCVRYTLRVVDQVEIKPSPFWLQQQLLLSGLTPINHIVDITNWVLLELGQPMHAFDWHQIAGAKLFVKKSEKKQTLHCLDGEKRTIYPETLIIADAKKPVAVAGVIGGVESAISSKTTCVVFEAAYFAPQAVRSSMKDLSVRTESGIRFEKGTDSEMPALAIERAIELLQEATPQAVASSLIDEYPRRFTPQTIRCRTSRVEEISGRKFSLSEVQTILQDLGCKVRTDKNDLLVQYPSYRHDISSEIDLISEVCRIYGYNHFEKIAPLYRASSVGHAPMHLFEQRAKNALIQEGLQECITCDLISPQLATLTVEPSFPPDCLVRTLHSKTEELSVLRPSLLPGLLEVLKHNQNHKNFEFYGFEIGNVHFKQDRSFLQQAMGGILLAGTSMPSHWDAKGAGLDFYDLKGIVENLVKSLRIQNVHFAPSKHPSLHPFRQAALWVDDIEMGVLGQVHPEILEELSIRDEAFFSEINLENLAKAQDKKQKFSSLAIYPSSERDWTLTLQQELPIAHVYEAIAQASSKKLEKVELIDLYTSEQLGTNKKNVTFRFSYRDTSKTISMQEVEEEHKKVVKITTDLLQDHIIS